MLLSRRDILEQIKRGRLRFDPAIDLKQVKQISIDLHIGRLFTTFKKENKDAKYLAAVRNDPSIWTAPDIWDHVETDRFTLEPGAFVLGKTHERVYLPDDLGGLIEGRSGYARLGISMHCTAPKIDPGFGGTIALEMSNNGSLPVVLVAGEDSPAQLLLFKLSRRLTKKELYGADEGDVFQGQSEPIPTQRRKQPKKK